MVLRLLRPRRLDRRLGPPRAVPEPAASPGTTPSSAGRTGRPSPSSTTEVPLPTSPSLEIRSHGLWAEHIGTHPLERWQVANEAPGVAVDDPAELYRPGGARGDLVPMGLDLEWETDGEPYHYALHDPLRDPVPRARRGAARRRAHRVRRPRPARPLVGRAGLVAVRLGVDRGPARRRHPLPRLRHPRPRHPRRLRLPAAARRRRRAGGVARPRATAPCTPRRSSAPRGCRPRRRCRSAGSSSRSSRWRSPRRCSSGPRGRSAASPGRCAGSRRRRPDRPRLDGVEPARVKRLIIGAIVLRRRCRWRSACGGT